MQDSSLAASGAAAPFAAERCTVVIPCYNEAARFRASEYEQYLKNEENDNIHLLFVNDGSRDGTLAMLQAFRDRFPDRVRVLDQQPNRGKAEAVRRGMLEVIADGQSDVTGFWDADLATPLVQINDMLTLLAENPELNMVFGARVRLLGHAIRRQPLRHYLGRFFATAVSVMLRLAIYDSQCGAKLFRVTPELRSVLTEPFHSRWIFDVEILARFLSLHQGNTREFEREIYEFPLPAWTDVAGSKVSSTDFFRAFGELVAIYRRDVMR
jgi:dolichyl-phosphate beta-glucosyltransferase